MGMFDYVLGPDGKEYQSKCGPCILETYGRDELDEDGAWLINEYYGNGGEHWRRGPDGWVAVSNGRYR